MVVGIRRGIEVERVKAVGGMEGMMELRLGRERWRLVRVYINGDLEEKIKCMRGWMEEKGVEIRMVIGGREGLGIRG